MRYSVVVPCYNEEKNIVKLVERFVPIEKGLRKDGFELILVNNGSVDGTGDAIEKELEKHSFIKTVLVPVNKGYGYGILQGLNACGGEYLGWIHADLQLPPEAFLEMVNELDNRVSDKRNVFFKARRYNRPLMDSVFTLGMSIFETIYLGQVLYDINAQPTMITREFFSQMENPPYDFSLDLFFYYMAKKKKYTIVRVKVKQQEREVGKSSWNDGMRSRFKLVKRTLSFSKKLRKKYR